MQKEQVERQSQQIRNVLEQSLAQAVPWEKAAERHETGPGRLLGPHSRLL